MGLPRQVALEVLRGKAQADQSQIELARWAAYEDWCFTAIRPPTSFDLVVSGQ